jgi:mannose-1-phosphate guanylyltransferase
MTDDVFALVLAGGRGERLWPLARRRRPKSLLSVGGRSLLAATVDRVAAIGIPPERTLILAGRDQAAAIRTEAGRARVLLEPDAGDTARAVALGALAVLPLADDAILAVFPSDHVVSDPAPLRVAVLAAIDGARRHKRLVALGTEPRAASTAYGWLRPGAPLDGGDDCLALLDFVEKPDAPRARVLWESGYLWNCGTFVFPARRLIEAFEQFQPALLEEVRRVASGEVAAWRAGGLSIDHAVLEPAAREGWCAVVPLRYQRIDLGRLDALAAVLPRDHRGNAAMGDVVALDTDGCVLYAKQPTLAVIGLANLVVVVEGDVVLVCRRDEASDVRRLVAELRTRGREGLL